VTNPSSKFATPPRTLSEPEFVKRFGGIYENSPWIAETLWRRGLDASHDSVVGVATALAAVVDTADSARKLALINAHPDLAGRAAVAGELTADSTAEQASAGIDQCNAEEFERFQNFNARYKNKFSFPFIMAVKGSNRHAILAAFEQRLENGPKTEFATALAEVHKIARLRLSEMAAQESAEIA